MKALVTGANGFLGFEIVKQLVERGDSVTGMTRKPDDRLSRLGVRQVHGDIRDASAVQDACEGQEVVFHTAAISGIWGPWQLFHATNTIGTRNVVEACRAYDVSRLVYTSSPSVTFDGEHQIQMNESAPYPKTWLCHYPHSKALAEKYVLDANEAPELMTCALRPHLIWGPGDRHLIPRLLERARSGKLRRVGDGRNQIDTIYVANAAEAHLQAGDQLFPESPVCGHAYFLSQDDPVNCWQWINEILELAGVPPVKRSISFRAAYRIGHLLEMAYEIANRRTEPRMTRFLAAQLAKSHYFDISAAKRDFGYQPRISMEEGMKRLGASLGTDS